MVANAITVIVVVVLAVGILLELVRRRRELSIDRPQQLAGEDPNPAAVMRVAAVSAQLPDDDFAASRLGQLARALFSSPGAESTAEDVGEQLRVWRLRFGGF